MSNAAHTPTAASRVYCPETQLLEIVAGQRGKGAGIWSGKPGPWTAGGRGFLEVSAFFLSWGEKRIITACRLLGRVRDEGQDGAHDVPSCGGPGRYNCWMDVILQVRFTKWRLLGGRATRRTVIATVTADR